MGVCCCEGNWFPAIGGTADKFACWGVWTTSWFFFIWGRDPPRHRWQPEHRCFLGLLRRWHLSHGHQAPILRVSSTKAFLAITSGLPPSKTKTSSLASLSSAEPLQNEVIPFQPWHALHLTFLPEFSTLHLWQAHLSDKTRHGLPLYFSLLPPLKVTKKREIQWIKKIEW